MAKSRAAWRPARKGALISPGKKPRPVSAACWAGGSCDSTWATDQVLDRVVAEERGEQRGDRRQVGHPLGHVGGHAVGHQTVEQVGGQRGRSDPRSSG